MIDDAEVDYDDKLEEGVQNQKAKIEHLEKSNHQLKWLVGIVSALLICVSIASLTTIFFIQEDKDEAIKSLGQLADLYSQSQQNLYQEKLRVTRTEKELSTLSTISRTIAKANISLLGENEDLRSRTARAEKIIKRQKQRIAALTNAMKAAQRSFAEAQKKMLFAHNTSHRQQEIVAYLEKVNSLNHDLPSIAVTKLSPLGITSAVALAASILTDIELVFTYNPQLYSAEETTRQQELIKLLGAPDTSIFLTKNEGRCSIKVSSDFVLSDLIDRNLTVPISPPSTKDSKKHSTPPVSL
jgi:hypothetical protein